MCMIGCVRKVVWYCTAAIFFRTVDYAMTFKKQMAAVLDAMYYGGILLFGKQ